MKWAAPAGTPNPAGLYIGLASWFQTVVLDKDRRRRCPYQNQSRPRSPASPSGWAADSWAPLRRLVRCWKRARNLKKTLTSSLPNVCLSFTLNVLWRLNPQKFNISQEYIYFLITTIKTKAGLSPFTPSLKKGVAEGRKMSFNVVCVCPFCAVHLAPLPTRRARCLLLPTFSGYDLI